jgi:hypothetical protein
MTPEEKLCSRSWRMRHSAWVLISILSVGMLAWIGFLYVGLRMRKARLLVLAGIYFGAMIAWGTASTYIDTGTKGNPVHSTPATILSISLMVLWGGSILLSILNNRSWLRWLAHAVPKAWYAGKSYGAPLGTPTPPTPEATIFGARPTTPTPAAGHPAPPTSVSAEAAVDLNKADAGQLRRALGLDQAWADHLILTRTRIGEYSSPDQLLTEARMPPHMYVTLQHRISVTPPSPVASSRAAASRKLDL